MKPNGTRSHAAHISSAGALGSPAFHIRVLSSDGRSIVYVSGELDSSTANRLRHALAGVISAGARHVVVDLRDVSFMGASGLGVLVGAGQRLRRDDGRLLLRSAPPSVQRLIEITGLDATLPRVRRPRTADE